MFTSPLPLTGSYRKPDESPLSLSHPVSSRSILIPSYCLCLVFPVDSYCQIFPPKPSMLFSFSALCPTCPTHQKLRFDQPNNIWQEVQLMKLMHCSFMQSAVISSFLVSNILSGIFFLYSLSLYSSFNVSDQV